MAIPEKLTNIADAIRAKSGSTDAMTMDEMVAAINSLKTQAVLTFSTSRGTAPAEAQATFSRPTAPTATGYTFADWYKDAALTELFDFAAPAESATAYAKWRINQPTVSHPDIEADGTTSYTLGTVTPAASDQTVEYSADNVTWSSTCPKQSADGTYTTYWRITADGCDALTGSFTTKISSDVVTDAIVSKLTAAASSRSLSALTWAELLLAAQSLEKKGTASKAYSAAVACAKNGAYRTTTYNGTTVYATLVGVLQARADASGNKRGLQFMTSAGAPSSSALMGTSNGVTTGSMNSSNTNSGGWGSCAMRTSLATSGGSIASLFASDLKAVIQPTYVPYNATYSATTSYTMSYTSDFMWLMSFAEVYGNAGMNDAFVNSWWGISGSRPWMREEGEQFLWFADKGMYGNSTSDYNFTANAGGSTNRWLRSCYPSNSTGFGFVGYGSGSPYNGSASGSRAVFPCFSL